MGQPWAKMQLLDHLGPSWRFYHFLGTGNCHLMINYCKIWKGSAHRCSTNKWVQRKMHLQQSSAGTSLLRWMSLLSTLMALEPTVIAIEYTFYCTKILCAKLVYMTFVARIHQKGPSNRAILGHCPPVWKSRKQLAPLRVFLRALLPRPQSNKLHLHPLVDPIFLFSAKAFFNPPIEAGKKMELFCLAWKVMCKRLVLYSSYSLWMHKRCFILFHFELTSFGSYLKPVAVLSTKPLA